MRHFPFLKYNYPTELEIQIPRDSAVHVSPTEGQKRSKILTQRSLFIRLINTELKIYPGFATFGVFFSSLGQNLNPRSQILMKMKYQILC